MVTLDNIESSENDTKLSAVLNYKGVTGKIYAEYGNNQVKIVMDDTVRDCVPTSVMGRVLSRLWELWVHLQYAAQLPKTVRIVLENKS